MSHIPKKKSASAAEKAKELPWATVLGAVVVVGKRWRSLSSKERERLTGLLRESGGKLNALSAKERKELRKIAGKLDLKGMGAELMALRAGRGRRGRRRGA
jgi:hypothetical protein